MAFEKAVKILAITLFGFVIVSIALLWLLSIHVNDVLKAELSQRLPGVSQKLGISLKYDDVSFNPVIGPLLEGVSIASNDKSPFMSVESIELLYSIHLRPTFHIRIDGIRLVRPNIQLSINEDSLTRLPDTLAGLFYSGDVVAKGSAEELLGPVTDAGVPVELPEKLKIVWEQGELHIVDERSALMDTPVRAALHGITGKLTYDRKNADSLFKTKGRMAKDGGRMNVKASMSEGDFKIELQAKDFRLDTLKAYFPQFVIVSDKTIADLKLTATVKGSLWDSDFQIDMSGIALNHWRLADRQIRDIYLLLSGNLQYDTADRRLQFDPLNINTNGFFLKASGNTEFADGFKLNAFIESEREPIQKALSAIPKGFAPALEGAKVDGTIKIGMDFAIDMANLKALKFEPKIEIEDFKLLKAPSNVDIERLKQPFRHIAKKKGEVVKEFLVGHPNYRYVPYQRLGKDTIKGVLTCEDGSFFRHNGFRVDHFRESLIQDLREGRFARGASTITMQTAKNLFLTDEKNLSRKFQEILIAYAMEQMLTKKRILEIYMNIIEWGPRIYGIGAASKHYFNIWPKDLNPLEAAFLGSIIPTPWRGQYMYRRGHVTDQWATYLALIVSKMGIHGQEYTELDPFQPEFDWVKKKRLAEEKKRTVTKKKPRLRSRRRGRR